MTYRLGKRSGSPLQRRPLTLRNPRSEALCAPSAIRTRALLLRSNPDADAVANWDDAGQARGGTRCCSPSYLVIAIEDTGRTIATKDTAWTVPQAVASSRLTVLGPSATAGDSWRCDPAARHAHLPDGHGNAHDGGAALTITAWYSPPPPRSAGAVRPNVLCRRDLGPWHVPL
jgi:hypothetical protein